MATGPSLLNFRNRRASWNKYALNQFKAVNRESYVPELDARGHSKSALISRRKALSLSLIAAGVIATGLAFGGAYALGRWASGGYWGRGGYYPYRGYGAAAAVGAASAGAAYYGGHYNNSCYDSYGNWVCPGQYPY
jgi:hypothetical protein